MSTPIARLLILVCAALAVVPATASAASRASSPKVTSVSPLNVKLGDKLTIRGSGFLKGKNRNTVVLKRDGARAVFIKAERATATQVVVTLSARKLSSFITSGPARFRVRVLARRLSESYTPASKSPRIAEASGTSASTPTKITTSTGGSAPANSGVASTPAPAAPADYDGDGTPDPVDPDDDNDLLADAFELQLRTGARNADTDGDGMEDGWEYASAVDLNTPACATGVYSTPCPAVAPAPELTDYPNPLWQDAGFDHDGDVLTAGEEYTAWARHNVRTLTNMWYSDGRQASQHDAVNDGICRGMQVPAPLVPDVGPNGPADQWPMDFGPGISGPAGGVGCLTDDERDEDADGLSNYDETHGPLTRSYWSTFYPGEGSYPVTFRQTNWLNGDSDGDGILDGRDDQDGDDITNLEESRRGTPTHYEDGTPSGVTTGLWNQPFSPCLPNRWSDTCSRYVPEDAYAPFYKVPASAVPRWPLYIPFNTYPVWSKKGLADNDQPPLPAHDHLISRPS